MASMLLPGSASQMVNPVSGIIRRGICAPFRW
jgi:hypothetical protein